MPILPLSIVFVLLAACSGGEATPTTPAKPAEPQPAAKAEPAPTLPMDQLQSQAKNITLVPSPAEMQRAMDKAGIAGGISGLVVDRQLKMDVQNKDVIAVRTGVILADALLTVKDAPKEKIASRLGDVKAGLVALGAGKDLPATVDDLIARLNNDSLNRDDLLKELDELHGAVIPEIEYEAGARCVPLIQAGSWLEGSNLVSGAILKANKPEAGTQLLRQPQVVDYFLQYVATEGADKAPDEVLKQLQASLNKLKEIAVKPALTIDDVKEVKSQTDAVLSLL